MYTAFKEAVKVRHILNSLGKFVITSWLRPEGTHSTGYSFDLAPRYGQGYLKKLSGQNPRYDLDKDFVSRIITLSKDIKAQAPHIRIIGIEPTHLHISFMPVPTINANDVDLAILTKDTTGTMVLVHSIN